MQTVSRGSGDISWQQIDLLSRASVIVAIIIPLSLICFSRLILAVSLDVSSDVMVYASCHSGCGLPINFACLPLCGSAGLCDVF